jgi:enolase-phosphatase E1
MTTAIVLDIEGTTSPTASVHDNLFGYVSQRIHQWVKQYGAGSGRELLAAARRYADRPDATDADTADMLCGWLDANVKCAPLKCIQGRICGEGFRNGELHGEFFADVPPAIRRWRARGARVYVYSSGSEGNQRDWFTYAKTGSLDDLIDGYFDLVSAGSKHTTAAYWRITHAIRAPLADTLFLSDSPAELEAAANAGWAVLGVARPGEPQQPVPPYEWISSFDEAEIDIHQRPTPAIGESNS